MRKMVCGGGGESSSNSSKDNSFLLFKAMHLVSLPNGISALKRPKSLTKNTSPFLGSGKLCTLKTKEKIRFSLD